MNLTDAICGDVADYIGVPIKGNEDMREWFDRAAHEFGYIKQIKTAFSIGEDLERPRCGDCGYEADLYECNWMVDGTLEYSFNYCFNCGAKVS